MYQLSIYYYQTALTRGLGCRSVCPESQPGHSLPYGLTFVVIDPARLMYSEYRPPSATLYIAKKRKNLQTSLTLLDSSSADIVLAPPVLAIVRSASSKSSTGRSFAGDKRLIMSMNGDEEIGGAGLRKGRMDTRRKGITRQITWMSAGTALEAPSTNSWYQECEPKADVLHVN